LLFVFKGFRISTGSPFILGKLRAQPPKENHWDAPDNTVAAMPRTTRTMPNFTAPWCNCALLALGDFSSKVRKNPIVPRPKVAIVIVVLIHTSVVRSSASCVRYLAIPVRSRAKSTRGSAVFGCC